MYVDYTTPENQQLLKDRLHEGTVLVSFTKKNGERRDMLCTLCPNLLPEHKQDEAKSTRPASTTSIAVYDVNAKGWRSFCWDSIINVTKETTV